MLIAGSVVQKGQEAGRVDVVYQLVIEPDSKTKSSAFDARQNRQDRLAAALSTRSLKPDIIRLYYVELMSGLSGDFLWYMLQRITGGRGNTRETTGRIVGRGRAADEFCWYFSHMRPSDDLTSKLRCAAAFDRSSARWRILSSMSPSPFTPFIYPFPAGVFPSRNDSLLRRESLTFRAAISRRATSASPFPLSPCTSFEGASCLSPAWNLTIQYARISVHSTSRLGLRHSQSEYLLCFDGRFLAGEIAAYFTVSKCSV